MELLAEPQPALAWACPECGHGSPEPRDQQAHLDAHRQLRQFFREWDAAAAADRRSRRPLVIGSLALVAAIALAVLALLRVSGGGDEAPPFRPALPTPGPEAPRAAAPPPAAAPASPAQPELPAGTTTRPAQPPPAGGAGAGNAGSVTAAGSAGIAPPRAAAATATAPAPPVATIPPAAATATPAGLAVHGCLLVVCVELGS